MMPPATSSANPSSQNSISRTTKVHSIGGFPPVRTEAQGACPNRSAAETDAVLRARPYRGTAGEVASEQLVVDTDEQRIRSLSQRGHAVAGVPEKIAGREPVPFRQLERPVLDAHRVAQDAPAARAGGIVRVAEAVDRKSVV